MKVLDIREVLSGRYGENFLEGEKWELTSGDILKSNRTMDEVRSDLTALLFFQQKGIIVEPNCLFWHNFLQKNNHARFEVCKAMLLNISIGGTGLADLRIEGNINKHFWSRTKIKAILHDCNDKNEDGRVYDKFHYETILWDGQIDYYASFFEVPPLPEYVHGYTQFREEKEAYRCDEWSHSPTWPELFKEIFGNEKGANFFRHLVTPYLTRCLHIGQILVKSKSRGHYWTINVDRCFDENGTAYGPEEIYKLRLCVEVQKKLSVIKGWANKDTEKAIKSVSVQNPIIYVPAYNFKWNDDVVIHSSLLKDVEPGIKQAVVDII